MSFKQEIFILLYLFILGKNQPPEWCAQLRDDVIYLLKNCSYGSSFKNELIQKALPYSPKRLRFYSDFIKFIDNYLKLI